MEKELWYIMNGDDEYGPYDDFSKAYWAGTVMFGQDGFGIYRRTETI